jgi:DNA replication and repair protein RecF
LDFSDKLNYLVGGNGQGKTTILESIYFLCTTKSNSSKSDSEAVSFNENEFEIKGLFKDITDHNIRLYYSLTENKKFYFQNNKLISRSAEVIGKFPVVILTPADHAITQGVPAERRRLIDSVISQASETYLKTLLDFNKTLRQRSSLLTQIKENKRKSLLDELDAWSAKLVNTGSQIIKYRLKFVEEFNNYICESYSRIMNEDEIPSISYAYLDDDAAGNIEEKFERILLKKREEELRRGTNLAGPHRDDFVFSINGINLKTFGSQGQHKTFQIVLRFAQFFYLKEMTGKSPIFLLDDVFGELDAFRASRISSYLRQVGQAFITVTDFANLSFLQKDDSDLLIKIKQGAAAYA